MPDTSKGRGEKGREGGGGGGTSGQVRVLKTREGDTRGLRVLSPKPGSGYVGACYIIIYTLTCLKHFTVKIFKEDVLNRGRHEKHYDGD